MATVQVPRGIHRRTAINVTESLRKRMQTGVSVRSESECWPWLGALRNGYGAIKHEKKVLGSHVVAYVLAHGELPDGTIVTHDCDNRICCNPAHLKAGTPQSNVREMYSRRDTRIPRGELAWNAKLTDDIVREIRRMYRPGSFSYQRIAKLLNIHPGAVRGVVYGKTWNHVT